MKYINKTSISTPYFSSLNEYIDNMREVVSASAAASYVICNDQVVNEWYSGQHDFSLNSRKVDEKSRFNIASVRKTYLGLVVSVAVYEGEIKSIDDPILDYGLPLANLDDNTDEEVTIRHLLTHTHGLTNQGTGAFPAGTDWNYKNVGVNLLVQMIQNVYNKPLAQIVKEKIFNPYGFVETGWEQHHKEDLVWLNEQYSGDKGNDPNLFVSTRELALWGYLHLSKGNLKGKQNLPPIIFEQSTSIVSPITLKPESPRNGFFWWVKDIHRDNSEMGHELPVGSYQSLGVTGCACLVIPQYNTVAVKMLNQTVPNPAQYDYVQDIQTFGNMVLEGIKQI
ncbi:serine hydrolase domain-containing protein [Chengkuizengella axinellae]|uniref:Serine hydrolase domain-containing protein n=1 Tax=Chengkuizengella axinellae TaxID=3064388 RepID=A0ABT9IU59_9BACL|nr:serine hydrolase domain-containing protein [Chengkuizengella sp. 2205SS18-9]MDP5272888.1 serine hydrolase domain-containing protein [Chengkuizengella sp. 2205SS18-9]